MKRRSRDKYRSAINQKPLRRAGQSIEEKIYSLFDDKILGYLFGMGMCIGFMSFTWIFFFLPYTLAQAIIMTVIALMTAIVFFKKALRIKNEIKSYREGLNGERFMGDHLNNLREKGCKVFHDFVVESIDAENNSRVRNVDHIIVNNKGIFAIETKALRKNKEQNEKLCYDGKIIKYTDGRELKIQPMEQAQTSARDVNDFLLKNIGNKYFVQPVVVYPGWYVAPSTNRNNKNKHHTWVCNPDFLDGLINSGPDKLSSQQINVISNKLSDYIRNYDSKK